MITAGELIMELEKVPLDARVVLPGHEGGWNDVDRVKVDRVEANPSRYGWWDGVFVSSPHGEDAAKLIRKDVT